MTEWLGHWTWYLGVIGSIPVALVMCKSLGQALNPHHPCTPSCNGYQVERKLTQCEWQQLQKILNHRFLFDWHAMQTFRSFMLCYVVMRTFSTFVYVIVTKWIYQYQWMSKVCRLFSQYFYFAENLGCGTPKRGLFWWSASWCYLQLSYASRLSVFLPEVRVSGVLGYNSALVRLYWAGDNMS